MLCSIAIQFLTSDSSCLIQLFNILLPACIKVGEEEFEL
jgi:hypothetical protein